MLEALAVGLGYGGLSEEWRWLRQLEVFFDGFCEWRQVTVWLAVRDDGESGPLAGLLEAMVSFISKWWRRMLLRYGEDKDRLSRFVCDFSPFFYLLPWPIYRSRRESFWREKKLKGQRIMHGVYMNRWGRERREKE